MQVIEVGFKIGMVGTIVFASDESRVFRSCKYEVSCQLIKNA